MKKVVTLLISAIMLTSIFSNTATAQERMSNEQIQAVYDDYQENYLGKSYDSGNWVYRPYLYSTYTSKYDLDAEITGAEIAFEISKYKNQNATSVTIPSSIDGNKILYIDGTFKSNTKLKKVIYSNGIKSTGVYVFKNHKKLQKLLLPTSIETIESQAFYNCKNLKIVTLPKNIIIKERAFKNCKNLKTLNYKGTSDYNDLLFSGAENGESVIEKEAFANCVKLKNINLGKSRLIDEKAFYNCKSLKSISIPKNMITISDSAFEKCENLAKVKIKSTKESPVISRSAFKNTKKGLKFVVKNKKIAKQLKKQLKKSKSKLRNAKILVGKKVVYKNING